MIISSVTIWVLVYVGIANRQLLEVGKGADEYTDINELKRRPRKSFHQREDDVPGLQMWRYGGTRSMPANREMLERAGELRKLE